MSTFLESKIDVLKERAHLLAKVRSFFALRNVLEVDCPALSLAAPIDLHIEVMSVALGNNKQGYLHTSPEYCMKRLLSQGMGDIYQMSKVYRQEEVGPLHNPEFTLVEWYRQEISFSAFIEETLDFIRLFLPDLPSRIVSYRQALIHYAGIDYVTATIPDLLSMAASHGVILSSDATWDKDALLQLLLSVLVEPHLGQNELCVLTDYPASQAALAKTYQKEDEAVAERFEIYYKGVELTNGYHELTDPHEQRRRLVDTNVARKKLGKQELPIDENFLEALERGLPDCCGVAVGFDRLLLLKLEKTHLKEVMPFVLE